MALSEKRTDRKRSHRFESKRLDASRLRVMMRAPKARFHDDVREQWSGDEAIRCVSCGSVSLYGAARNSHCHDCGLALDLQMLEPIISTQFVLDLNGGFVSADEHWDRITLSVPGESTGRLWAERIDPQCHASLDKAGQISCVLAVN